MILNMGVPALAQASEPSLASEPAAAESSSSSAGSSSSAAGNGDLAIGASSVTITITAFDALPTEVMQQPIVTGTAVEQLHLPAELNATGEAAPEAIIIADATWQIDPTNMVNGGNSAYDPQGGTDCFTPLLPVGYTVAQGVSLPEIYVQVGTANTLASLTGNFTVTGGTYGTDYSYASSTLTILSETPLTISGTTTTDKIVVQSGVCANITLAGVSIVLGNNICPLNMNEAGESTVTLAAGTENTLDGSASTDGAPGIWVPNSKKLTIAGAGKLVAKGSASWPGIGRSGNGNIEIESGMIEAVGGQMQQALVDLGVLFQAVRSQPPAGVMVLSSAHSPPAQVAMPLLWQAVSQTKSVKTMVSGAVLSSRAM